jgi:hypothetical protein
MDEDTKDTIFLERINMLIFKLFHGLTQPT